MTRAEAIKILEGAIKKPNTKDGYLGQALSMAINSLKVDEMYQLEKEDADEFIPKSVIEDIKAEIRSIQPKWYENAGKHNCIDEVIKIIDKHISGKDQE